MIHLEEISCKIRHPQPRWVLNWYPYRPKRGGTQEFVVDPEERNPMKSSHHLSQLGFLERHISGGKVFLRETYSRSCRPDQRVINWIRIVSTSLEGMQSMLSKPPKHLFIRHNNSMRKNQSTAVRSDSVGESFEAHQYVQHIHLPLIPRDSNNCGPQKG